MKIMSELTPKRKVGEEDMLFFPRYRISVKVQYESKARQTGTENLFQPSKQKDSIGVVIAKQCENMGLTLKPCEGKSALVDGHYISCTRLLHVLCTVITKGRVYVEKKDQSAVLLHRCLRLSEVP